MGKYMPQDPESGISRRPKPDQFWDRIRTGIRGRILLLLLIILLPVFTIQAFLFFDRYRTVKDREFQSNMELARMVAGAFESFIQDIHLQELAVGIALTATPPLSPWDAKRLLEESVRDFPAIRGLSWVGPDGRILVSSDDRAVDTDISAQIYFQKIVSGHEWVVSDLIESGPTREPLFVIGRAMHRGQTQLLGAVIAEVEADRLDAVLSVERSKEGSINLIDSRGVMVYRYPKVVTTMEGRNWIKGMPDIGDMFSREYAGLVIPPYDNRRRIMASRPIASIGWIASACSIEDEVMRPIYMNLLRDSALFLLVAIASFLVSLVLSRSISGPIKKLQRHAVALSQGEMETKATLRGPSEIRDLARIFNQMAWQIRTWMEKAEQRALEAEEEKRVLDALMEHVPEGIAIADTPDMKIRRMSRYGQEESGRRAEISRGTTLSVYYDRPFLIHMDGKTVVPFDELPLARATRKGEVVKDAEFILRKADGSELVVLCNAGPITNAEAQVTGGVVAWRNITERKKMEDDLRASRNELEQRVHERTAELEQTNQALVEEIRMREQAEKDLAVQAVKLEQSNREMQDFVFIASHDLQEPLRKLQTLGDLLSIRCRGSLSDEGLDYIDRIRNSARRMREFLVSLLGYSRLSTKSGQFQRVSLSETAMDALANLEILTAETGGSVDIGDLPVVEADVTQMILLFQNLIQNSLRFHREGVQPRVKIYSRNVDNGRFKSSAYEIFVEDNGIGFEEKYLDRIFLPFERLHARDAYGGVGMGLAICKKIVERHNGFITARSTPGKGATFIVTIPAEQEENGSLHHLDSP